MSAAERVTSIKTGQYDDLVIPDNLGVLDLAEKQGVKLVALAEPVKVNATYVLVNKKEDKLAAENNEALKALRAERKKKKINIKWHKNNLMKLLK